MMPGPKTDGHKSARTCLLIYDGQCQLCVVTKQQLEKAGVGQDESDIRFLPYQSEEAKQTLGQNYRDGRPDMAFLVRPSGEIHQGLDAFLPLLPSLPGGRVLLWCMRIPFVKGLAACIYRIVARHRYRLFGEARPPYISQ